MFTLLQNMYLVITVLNTEAGYKSDLFLGVGVPYNLKYPEYIKNDLSNQPKKIVFLVLFHIYNFIQHR